MINPRNLPQQSREKTIEIAKAHGIDVTRPFLLGMRGYFRDSMGKVGVNDRGIYDDAIFLNSQFGYYAFWANTDPSKYRNGSGTGAGKGMAVLNAGLWKYTLGIHGLSKPKERQYEALIQADKVAVTRDGNPPYQDTGWFGINIHKGGYNTTSSEGCQTIHPDQWGQFIVSTKSAMRDSAVKTIPYLLIEQQG